MKIMSSILVRGNIIRTAIVAENVEETAAYRREIAL
jgi:hypothetical protein